MATQLLQPPPVDVTGQNGQSIVGADLAGGGMLPQSQSPDELNGGGPPLDDEVRTLFVSGLPMNATQRELRLLFFKMKGYEGSLLKGNNKNGKHTSPVGFVTFDSKTAAENARNLLQGDKFDTEQPQTLRLEFAKSNTKVTKPKINNNNNNPAAASSYLPFTHQDFTTAAFLPAGADAWSALPAAYELHNPALQHAGLPALPANYPLSPHVLAQLHAGLPPGLAAGLASAPNFGHLAPNHLAAVSQAGLPGAPTLQASPVMATSPTAVTQAALGLGSNAMPSNTLFVSNLSILISDQEVTNMFNSFGGFVRLRMAPQPIAMQNGMHYRCAFVEYSDVRCATDVMTKLQGLVPRNYEEWGGIHIEYSNAKIVG